MALKDEGWRALRAVPYPGFDRDIVSFGMVESVDEPEPGLVHATLKIGHVAKEAREEILAAAGRALGELPAARGVKLSVTSPGAPAGARRGPAATRPPESSRGPNLRRILAVGSGKGGVGKSTVAANLAVSLATRGERVGLLDADVYGPNIPRMLGIGSLPPPSDGDKIRPALAHGVQTVSIGLMVKRETPLIWRGPITDRLIRQFTTDVSWGTLDVLVVDLPPGTGDIAMSVAQYMRPDGALVVVTPQEVALDDGRKAISMFERLEVPLLGVIENMSYFPCPNCGTRHDLFGRGGGARLADEVGTPLLGEIPFEPAVRQGGDEGLPAVLVPESVAGEALDAVAGALLGAPATAPTAAGSRA